MLGTGKTGLLPTVTQKYPPPNKASLSNASIHEKILQIIYMKLPFLTLIIPLGA
jgi:hypothetical protein